MSSQLNNLEGSQEDIKRNESEQCAICFEGFVEKTTILPCEHKTCYDCIGKTMSAQTISSKTCPFCRGEIVELSRTVVEKISSGQTLDEEAGPYIELPSMPDFEAEREELRVEAARLEMKQESLRRRMDFHERIRVLEFRFLMLTRNERFLNVRLPRAREAVDRILDSSLNIQISMGQVRSSDYRRDSHTFEIVDRLTSPLRVRLHMLQEQTLSLRDEYDNRIRDAALEENLESVQNLFDD
ncbi:RING/U-box [Glarea lozoyensis ATCC 20868]|uniref:RING/U-box n=1 Tax=Glarea lozoyensis (strain ATCC 20868 / MF5171) TaxID=1116229 RepID=S3D7A6_GLAL2|nr:RING/U-box [Glarea lozoyensis ATCC 20868]EPE33024.1 RING/U-box [Glarea lozoyensis ATCC 20868]